MTITINSLAEKRRKWVEANRDNDFEHGIKRLLTDLYPDNAHFVYELLQNAEDAHAQVVRFILHDDCIEFEHDGQRLFSIEDVNSITSIGFSTKRDDTTTIGKFGVGFKAVFAYTETPEIESGDFHFKICDMVVPECIEESRASLNGNRTLFRLPFDNPKKPKERARNEIELLLKKLDVSALLFLTHIQKIEYLLSDTSLGYIEMVSHGDKRCEVRVQHPGQLQPTSSWYLKFDKDVQVEDDEDGTQEKKLKNCRIAVAFGLSQVEPKAEGKEKKTHEAEARPEWELVPLTPGRVCIYFPAEKETSNLHFHLHAPFASTVARDSVRECGGNDTLRDHLADLLAESMHVIRDQGLLTVRAFRVLPNDKDQLTPFYEPLMERLVEEFQQEDLVPMKAGGHAAADGIFRGSKALTDLIDDNDLVTLLGEDYVPPMWAANPPQRNQREDNFMSMLEIQEWEDEDLVYALAQLSDVERATWMGEKSSAWHQRFYAHLEGEVYGLKDVAIVRTSHSTYRKGHDCYFPSEDMEHDEKLPRVAKEVFTAGKNVDQQEKARKFLTSLGVREVDEQVEIEAILKNYYVDDCKRPNRKEHYNHLRRFIRFLESNTEEGYLFTGAKLFMVDGENGVEWKTSDDVYLDKPFVDTGISAYYALLGAAGEKWPLSSAYEKSGISADRLGAFAQKLDAVSVLEVQYTRVTKYHPEWAALSRNGGSNWTGHGTNWDWVIRDLEVFLESPAQEKAMLIWKTMVRMSHPKYLRCFFGRNKSNIAEGKSTLVHDLRKSQWVPQRDGRQLVFVQPCDAVAEKLPQGFEYQTGWKWLEAIEFGRAVEKRRAEEKLARERETANYKRKEEVAKEMGFESPEEASEIAKLKSENPEEFQRFVKEAAARKEPPSFPNREVRNPERRQERLDEQMSDSRDKAYEPRERSVRTTSSTIDPTLWLREQYTNEDDEMVCQICEDEMPFRKRDGEYYFESREVLSREYLLKEYEAQYLALCPTCAAKYVEFVKKDDSAMAELREAIVSVEGCEVPITLGEEETSIRFVETHLFDLKVILGTVEKDANKSSVSADPYDV